MRPPPPSAVSLTATIWWTRENNRPWFYNSLEKIGKRWALSLALSITLYVEKIGNNDPPRRFFNGSEKMGKWEAMPLVLHNAIEKVGKNHACFLTLLRRWARATYRPCVVLMRPYEGGQERDISLDSITLQRRWAASPLLRCEGIERVIALGCMSLLRRGLREREREASLRLTRVSLQKKERYGSEKIRR